MTAYRRHRVPGGTFFFTVAIADRRSDLLVRHIDVLKSAIETEKQLSPFSQLAMAVLPDHLHAIWRLPGGDSDYSNRWRRIKAGFSRALPIAWNLSASKRQKGERGIWQRRFWEHTVRNEEDLQRHLDYIHFNPVKHGHVTRVVDWPHSTFHTYVERGVYPLDWAGSTAKVGGDFGEVD